MSKTPYHGEHLARLPSHPSDSLFHNNKLFSHLISDRNSQAFWIKWHARGPISVIGGCIVLRPLSLTGRGHCLSFDRAEDCADLDFVYGRKPDVCHFFRCRVRFLLEVGDEMGLRVVNVGRYAGLLMRGSCRRFGWWIECGDT